jgi:hypothetical protein
MRDGIARPAMARTRRGETPLGLLDGDAGKPPSKLPRYIITTIVFVGLVGGTIFYLLRYHTEKSTVGTFMNALTSGDFQQAYRIWRPNPSYSFEDFLGDWGPTGEYGPVKSYRVESATLPRNSSGVVVVVELSRYSPFPADDDFEKGRTNKEVNLQVERSNQAISYAPPRISPP